MNRIHSRVLLAAAALALASSAFASSANVTGQPGIAGAPERVLQGGVAPKGYVSPQDRVKQSANTGLIVTPSGAMVKLPPGMHPNSLGAQSLIAKAEREAGATCSKKPCVPVIGRTADGKYPVYDLQGEPGDLNYISKSANTVFRPTDLYGRMGYVEMADLKQPGMRCDYLCRNAAGQAVGIDPEIRKFDPTLKGKK